MLAILKFDHLSYFGLLLNNDDHDCFASIDLFLDVDLLEPKGDDFLFFPIEKE